MSRILLEIVRPSRFDLNSLNTHFVRRNPPSLRAFLASFDTFTTSCTVYCSSPSEPQNTCLYLVFSLYLLNISHDAEFT